MSPGSLLAGRYRMQRRLAAGGMGEVWLAHDTVLSRDVAVKVLPVGGDVDAGAVDRFAIEARAMAALQHPNIVSIFDSGTPAGTAFIVMELLTGPTLAQLVAERGPLPEAEALALGAQVASGLGAAHDAGVIHRDIKPGNLMLSSAGMLKILDFGIARLAQTTTSGLTATNAVIGSAAYLSPEQAAGRPVDERSDLYSLGCVLFTMLAGRPPFIADHPMAVVHQQVNASPPGLRELRPEVSPALDGLVQRLLGKRPDARPGSAAEVEAELARIAVAPHDVAPAVAPTLALEDGAWPGAPAEPAATQPYPPAVAPAPPHQRTPAAPARSPQVQLSRTAPVARPPAPRRSSRWLVATGILAAVVLVLLASTALLDRGDEEASGPSGPTPSARRTSTTPQASSPTPQASSPTPKASSPTPTSTPRPSATVTARTPMERARAAVAAAVADGQLDAKKAEELLKRLAGLEKGRENGKKKGGKSGENLSRYLDGLVRKGELTAAGRQRIEAALGSL